MVLVSLMFVFLIPMITNADFLTEEKKADYENNIENIADDANYSKTQTLESIIGTVIRILLSILGTIFLILMVLAGNTWMRAGGNQEKVSKAKKQIQSLIIGLVVLLAAYALSYWIAEIFASILVN